MVPLPVLVLSVAMLAGGSASSAASGPGGMVPAGGGTSPYLMVWVSVKSTSLKANVPLVGAGWPVAGSVAERNPATTSWSPVKASAGAGVLMTGLSLVPVMVIVIGRLVNSLFAAKLFWTFTV